MAFIFSTNLGRGLFGKGRRSVSGHRTVVRMAATGPMGFIGLGIMGYPMAQNLINGGGELVVWNRSTEKSADLADKNPGKVTVVESPKEVIERCDITFSMLSTPQAVEAIYFGSGDKSALEGVSKGKRIVDCSTLTQEASQASADAVAERGGLFLEAPVSGSKVPAETGNLIFLCGGDKSTFDIIENELSLMGKKSFFLGPCGSGTRMKLVVNMIMGSMMAALSEGIALAEATDLDGQTLLDVLDLGAMANPLFKMKGGNMLTDKRNYAPHFPLEHAQKDMRFACSLADQAEVQMPVASAANQLFISARSQGFSREDLSAVIEALRTKQ
ncbi:hypothetical protein NDN08_007738 [Rhodosorus marinus]|uniref:3-hydroxyisobutyrate dehydrogenase n=1 Tax=Rhodosorus marinus TaxID=101924 RepID=A0AAV8V2I5_9RHOD|nr:hypothetical protein NDN08_007738 [Rhodosorus marinus]